MRFKQAWKMYPLLPMEKGKLPDAGFGVRTLEIGDGNWSVPSDFQVYCKPRVIQANPSWKNKSSKHRVYVICDCGRHVPFGRMGQHYTPKCSVTR